ncbi:uncharacterized protein [Oscarella lobularis]|uniref:uncharacterized protein n=1 Tax=Oscarella lobularis TaxID=121494 RepID=UPI00331339E0
MACYYTRPLCILAVVFLLLADCNALPVVRKTVVVLDASGSLPKQRPSKQSPYDYKTNSTGAETKPNSSNTDENSTRNENKEECGASTPLPLCKDRHFKNLKDYCERDLHYAVEATVVNETCSGYNINITHVFSKPKQVILKKNHTYHFISKLSCSLELNVSYVIIGHKNRHGNLVLTEKTLIRKKGEADRKFMRMLRTVECMLKPKPKPKPKPTTRTTTAPPKAEIRPPPMHAILDWAKKPSEDDKEVYVHYYRYD